MKLLENFRGKICKEGFACASLLSRNTDAVAPVQNAHNVEITIKLQIDFNLICIFVAFSVYVLADNILRALPVKMA